MTRIKFSIRDLLFVTVIVAILAGWWVDRSKLAWLHAQSLATEDRLRSMLTKADPGWQDKMPVPVTPIRPRSQSAVSGLVVAAGLVVILILIAVREWKKKLPPSIYDF